MNLKDGLERVLPAVIERLVAEQFDHAMGRQISEAARLPAAPGDGTLLDALLSEPTISELRATAREHVQHRVAAIRHAESRPAREAAKRGAAIREAQARRGGRTRLSVKGRQVLGSLLEIPTDGGDAAAQVPGRAGRAERVKAELRESAAERAQQTPAEGAAWAEHMRRRGLSETTIRALRGGEAS